MYEVEDVCLRFQLKDASLLLEYQIIFRERERSRDLDHNHEEGWAVGKSRRKGSFLDGHLSIQPVVEY